MAENGNGSCNCGKTRLTFADVVPGATTARAGKRAGNPYLPEVGTVIEIIPETPTIKTFRVRFDDPEVQENFTFAPGQVGQLGIFGVGEATFAITSKPSEKDFIQFSVMRAGEVTRALHNLSVGDKVGIRAPMGRGFPVEEWKGKNILYVMGGIGSAALKATIEYTLEHRSDYEKITILYGATHPTNFTYWYDVEEWQKRDDLELVLTIDRECEGWQCDVGLVPHVLERMAPSPENTIAITCGPPIMIKFALIAFEKLGFTPEQTYTTLEKRMKCGIGICGRCNVGPKYVCVDGPVFSLAELKELPDEL
ncbi:MAG: FAD/NAD(P)-binding protein [Thermoleophilia bacterium]|nr:FAD/NAD(P)-binding protein [Thermoleophilia bacterium]